MGYFIRMSGRIASQTVAIEAIGPWRLAAMVGRRSLMLRDHLFSNALSNEEYRATEFEPTTSNLGICEIAPFTA